MSCVNTHYANEHSRREERNEKALESFLDEIAPYLDIIEDASDSIKRVADSYSIELNEEIDSAIKEVL